jgi:hypothetical protein
LRQWVFASPAQRQNRRHGEKTKFLSVTNTVGASALSFSGPESGAYSSRFYRARRQ